MIITCPSCQTRFRIDPAALAPRGKMVRCSQCGHRWFAEPPAEELEPPPLPESSPLEATGEEGSAATVAARRSGAGTVLGWLLVVLMILLVAAMVLGRNEIVAAWPPAATLYRQLGLPVTMALGLELRNLGSERLEENGVPTLRITGEIANRTGQERILPPLRVALLDGEGRELDFGLFDPPRRRLEPGGLARFEARLVDPPQQAVRFVVTFASSTVDGS